MTEISSLQNWSCVGRN